MKRRTRFLGRSRVNAGNDLRVVAATSGFLLLGAVATIATGLGAPFLVALGVLVALALVPTRIDVGDDGVRIGWLRRRFVSFAQIVAVEPWRQDAVLVLPGGERLRLPLGGRNRVAGKDPKRDEFLAQVTPALRAYLASTSSAQALASAFARTRIALPPGQNDAAYRGPPPLTAESLWQLVEAPGASLAVRVGAVEALRPGLDEAGSRRVEAAGDASACEETRAGLRRAIARST